MSYIEIIDNSEKYMSLLEENDKISIRQGDIMPSQDIIDRGDTLWGYYDVILPKNNIFVGYKIICGDFFCGSGFLQKVHIISNSKEWVK